jgi:hypothetical protein
MDGPFSIVKQNKETKEKSTAENLERAFKHYKSHFMMKSHLANFFCRWIMRLCFVCFSVLCLLFSLLCTSWASTHDPLIFLKPSSSCQCAFSLPQLGRNKVHFHSSSKLMGFILLLVFSYFFPAVLVYVQAASGTCKTFYYDKLVDSLH